MLGEVFFWLSLLLLAIVAITSLTACVSNGESNTSKNNAILSSKPNSDLVQGELIVRFNSNSNYQQTIKTLTQDKHITFIKMLFDSKSLQIAHFSVPIGQEKTYIKLIEQNPNVKYAEQNALGSFN